MYTLPEGHVICMRTCDENLKSHGGFQWPESGEVVCPDWSAKPECENGLHGLLWGMGQADLLNWSPDAKWLAVEVEEKGIINLNGKVKFQKCRVVLCGDRKAVTDLVSKHAPNGTAVIGLVQDGGDRSTITGGDYSTLVLTYWDSKTGRNRCVLRYVGEDGIKPGVAYVADGMGGLMEAVRHEGGV